MWVSEVQLCQPGGGAMSAEELRRGVRRGVAHLRKRRRNLLWLERRGRMLGNQLGELVRRHDKDIVF